jgi:hypothetical protein
MVKRMKVNVNYEIKRALSKVTKCAIYEFTGYIYLLFTQGCERFPTITCLLCRDSWDRNALNCHYSLTSRSLELMRATDINNCFSWELVRTIRQCLTDEDETGN